MFVMKKTVAAMLVLSGSAAFAGSMGPVCSAVNVTAPCEKTGWEIGGHALYLKPSVSGLTTQETASTATASVTLGDQPNWGWGFMIEGAYYFNTGNDLNLNWYHLNNSHSRTHTGTGIFSSVALGLPVAGTTEISSTTSSSNPKWDAVNLELGQQMLISDHKSIRFHGGVEYARLSNNESRTALSTSTPTAGTASAITLVRSNDVSYNGFGPRIGTDLQYGWDNGLSVFANGATALLAGTSKFNTTHSVTGITSAGSSTVVVPELEAKLGLNYGYALAQGQLSVDAGWMWVNYFNPMVVASRYAFDGVEQSNFGVQGPFFGLKWMGN